MSSLFYNGTFITMEENTPQAQAMLVDGGKIIKVGSIDDVSACKDADTVWVDLQGRTVLPGFIDGHSHFSGLAMSLGQCDLSSAKNFGDIIRLMQAFMKENGIPDGEWVTGTNYDHNYLQEKRHPDKFVLDQISDRHPVVIIHASSHMGVANSMGLKRQNLDESTQNPDGGRYGRLENSTQLNGYMEESAFVRFRNAMPIPDMNSIMELFKKAQRIYAGYGITTVQEGMVTPPLLQLLRHAQQKGIFYLDIVGYLDAESCLDMLTSGDAVAKEYDRHFRIGGCKTFLDGSPQGRTAWMKEPYAGSDDGYCGYPIKTDEQLYQIIAMAVRNNHQLLAHCNGDKAAEQYIAQVEKVLADNPTLSAVRPVMIHAQLVQREQLARMARLSMMPSFFSAHTYYWGDIHIQNFGMERAKNISPAGTAVRLHIPFTLHQDSPVLPPNMMDTVWCAAKRITKSGTLLAQDERISVGQALKAATVYAAYQYGEEAEKGKLADGMRADFIVLDKNPLEVPMDEVRELEVLAAVKDGICVYRTSE